MSVLPGTLFWLLQCYPHCCPWSWYHPSVCSVLAACHWSREGVAPSSGMLNILFAHLLCFSYQKHWSCGNDWYGPVPGVQLADLHACPCLCWHVPGDHKPCLAEWPQGHRLCRRLSGDFCLESPGAPTVCKLPGDPR
jgi:hypothetical protein